ncbi:MAG TPA: choice-of-anchor J domain-containing protein [Bacteroidales bacterium]|nr:choice-of-anchor J domain-containing protein [Bacteroidales bacterium]
MKRFFLAFFCGLLLCVIAKAQEPSISSITGSMIPAGAIIARDMQPQAMESFGEIPAEFRSQWTSHGPYGGNIRRFATNGTNGMNVVVACANSGASNGGVWYSEDGGINWNPSTIQKKQMWGLAAHPTQAGKFYAGGEYGLYESTDGGANWDQIAFPSTFLLGVGLQTSNPQLMVAGPSTNRGLRYSSNGGTTWNNTNVTGGFMRNFTVSPANPSKMFVTLTGSAGGLYTSEDGATWTSINPSNSGECSGIYADPDNVDIILLSAENGIFKTVDGGANWSHKLSFSGYGFYGCNIVKYNNVLRTAFWYDDIYESADNGDSWTLVANNIMEKSWQALGVSDAGFLAGSYGTIAREEGQELILSVEGLNNAYVHCVAYYADRNELWAGTEGSGIWCSYDMGLTWNHKSSNILNWWGFSFAPTNDYNRQHGRMLVATSEGAFYTDDYGDSWEELHQTPGNNAYSGVMVHPGNSDIMWVGNDFVKYTTDGGTTWNTSAGLPFAFYPSFDLCENSSGGMRLLVNYEQLATETYYSDDMGANCTAATGYAGAEYFTDLSVRPAGDLPQMVYLSTDKGVYKSADGAVYTKCPNLNGLVWSVLGSTGTDVYAGGANGVFHSADEGQTWQPFNTGIEYITVWDLVYGNTSDVILAGTSGYSVYAYGLDNPLAFSLPFSENFEGQELPDGWQNINNTPSGHTWSFDNPGNRTITGAGFDNNFAIIDSDFYGFGSSQDADLITPQIDCSDASLVFLTFDQSYHQYLFSEGAVSVSSDGVNWTSVYEVTSNNGYPDPAVTVFLDITAEAANKSTVWIKWNYTGSGDYWWAIDNVHIYESGVGLNPQQDLSGRINISPNPANDHFAITSAKAGSMRIINQSGVVMMEMPIGCNDQAIDISRLPAGLYFVFIKTENGIDIKKLVKE